MHCLRDIQACRDNGYAVLKKTSEAPTYDIAYRLDAAGNRKALELIDSTKSIDEFTVRVCGEDAGNGFIEVTSIVETTGEDSRGKDKGPCGGDKADGEFDCMIELMADMKLRYSKPAASWTTLRLKVEETDNKGSTWVAFGIGSQMIDTDAVVGFTEGGAAKAAAYRLTSYANPLDGSCGGGNASMCPYSDMEATKSQNGIAVTATVSRANAQTELLGETEIKIIIARGTSEWKSYHGQTRASAVINLVQGSASKTRGPKYRVHMAHGTMMILAWLVQAPLASLIARGLRFGLLQAPMWFRAHIVLHAGAGVLFLIAVAVAISEFDSPKIPKSHKELGMAIIWLWAIQVLMGIFRPDNHGEVRFGFIQPSWRPQFLIAHRLMAALCLAGGAAQCVTGSERFKDLYSEIMHLNTSYALIATWLFLWIATEAFDLPKNGRKGAADTEEEVEMKAEKTSSPSV